MSAENPSLIRKPGLLERPKLVEPPLPITMEPGKARDILFASYFFSQGDNEFVQPRLFSYQHRIHPEWRVDVESLENDPVLLRRVDSVVLSDGARHIDWDQVGNPLTEHKVRGSLKAEVLNMAKTFSGEQEDSFLSDAALLRELTYGIIDRDYHHLIEEGGRTRRNKQVDQNGTMSPYEDPYLSHFLYYALAANPTGLEEYDLMFGDIKKSFPETVRNLPGVIRRKTIQRLTAVMEVYNSHHPNSPITFDKKVISLPGIMKIWRIFRSS